MQKEMTHTPKVSVVIPMYNCEEFVPGIFRMFSEQSFCDFEVICVIDGATDGTETEVKKICEKDGRFRYVIRENGGAGAARNTGIEEAKGKYIIFSDADDEYSDDYLKKPYEAAEYHNAQIAVFRFIQKNARSNDEKLLGYDENTILENTLYSHTELDDIFESVSSRITNKLFNREFIMRNRLSFPKATVTQDTYFCYASLSIADKIVFLKDILLKYMIYINPNSLTGKRAQFQHEAVDVLRLLYKWLKEHSLLDIHFDDYMRRVNRVLLFDGSFELTPKFISEFAHMLNAEEPFNKMSSREIIVFLKEGLFAEHAASKLQEFRMKIAPELIDIDEKLKTLLDYYRRRIHKAELLRQVSKDFYGRDFMKPGDVPLKED